MYTLVNLLELKSFLHRLENLTVSNVKYKFLDRENGFKTLDEQSKS